MLCRASCDVVLVVARDGDDALVATDISSFNLINFPSIFIHINSNVLHKTDITFEYGREIGTVPRRRLDHPTIWPMMHFDDGELLQMHLCDSVKRLCGVLTVIFFALCLPVVSIFNQKSGEVLKHMFYIPFLLFIIDFKKVQILI